jgi:Trimethylamine methyltransferase (MTTB)
MTALEDVDCGLARGDRPTYGSFLATIAERSRWSPRTRAQRSGAQGLVREVIRSRSAFAWPLAVAAWRKNAESEHDSRDVGEDQRLVVDLLAADRFDRQDIRSGFGVQEERAAKLVPPVAAPHHWRLRRLANIRRRDPLERPDAPAVFGNFLSSTALRSGSPTFGTAEPARGSLVVGQLARRFNLPFAGRAPSRRRRSRTGRRCRRAGCRCSPRCRTSVDRLSSPRPTAADALVAPARRTCRGGGSDSRR